MQGLGHIPHRESSVKLMNGLAPHQPWPTESRIVQDVPCLILPTTLLLHNHVLRLCYSLYVAQE